MLGHPQAFQMGPGGRCPGKWGIGPGESGGLDEGGLESPVRSDIIGEWNLAV